MAKLKHNMIFENYHFIVQHTESVWMELDVKKSDAMKNVIEGDTRGRGEETQRKRQGDSNAWGSLIGCFKKE